MDSAIVLILLSSLVIFSYLFDLVAKRTNLPSVLLLLGSGMIIHAISVNLGIETLDFSGILPLLGTIGLILIVLEGSLDLKYGKEKRGLILKALGAAFFILVITAICIAFFFQGYTGESFRLCLLNAIPFSVISSAVAIPSVGGLIQNKKEFLIYESSFSDILGIVFFNFVMFNTDFSGNSFLILGRDVVVVMLFSLLICFGLVFLMGKITHHVKFFLVISVLMLLYGIGKYFHLSSLLIVLVLGLFLGNLNMLVNWFENKLKFKKLRKALLYKNFDTDITQLKVLSIESAFLIRTFFFLVFGYTMNVEVLLSSETLIVGSATIVLILIVRVIYLQFVAKAHLWPEVLVSPRGLISVLLFVSIPREDRLFGGGNGLLLFIIISTGLLMTIGLISSKRQLPKEWGDTD